MIQSEAKEEDNHFTSCIRIKRTKAVYINYTSELNKYKAMIELCLEYDKDTEVVK